MEEGRNKSSSSSSSGGKSSSTSQKGAARRGGGGSISGASSSTGKKFFRCTVCSYVTNVKARFTKHVKYHSMPLIKCDFCDFKSPYKWNLDRHLKNHGGEGDLHCPLCNFTADIKQSLTVHVQNHHASITEQQLNFKIKQQQQQQQLLQQQQQLQQQMLMNENGELLEEEEEDEEQMQEDEEEMEDDNYDDDAQQQYLGPVDQYSQQQQSSMIPRKRSLCKESSPDESFFQKSAFLQSLALKPNVVYSVSNHDDEEEEDDEGEENEIDETGGTSSNILPSLLNNTTSTSSTTVTRLITPKSSPPGRRISINSNEGTSLLNKQLLLGNNSTKKSREKRLFLEELAQKLVASKSEEISSNSTKNSVTISTSSTSSSSLLMTNSTRCQFCRQRCKTSTDLAAHLTICSEATRASDDDDDESSNDGEKKVGLHNHNKNNNKLQGEQHDNDDEEGHISDNEQKDCTSENKIFVWNKFPYAVEDDEEEEDDEGGSMSSTNEIHLKNGYSDDLVGFETSPGIGAIHTGKLEELEYEGLDPLKLELLNSSVITTRKVYRCPQQDCGFWATTASRFHVHSVGHSNMKPFECSQCSYKSNWKWDITKHIKLKAIRDPLHANAQILAHESGQRNYRKYDKYLVMMQLKHSADSKLPDCSTLASKRTDVALELSPPTSSVTSPKVSPRGGGNSNVPTNLTMPKLTRAPITSRATSPSNSVKSEEGRVRPPPALVPIVGTANVSSTCSPPPSSSSNGNGRTIVEKRMLSGGHIFSSENRSEILPESTTGSYGEEQESNGPPNKKMRSSTGENLKKVFWKCKKCPYKHTSKEVVVFHIRQHHKPKRGESVSILSPNFLSSVAQIDDDSQEPDASSTLHQQASVKETHQYVFNQNDGIYKCKFCPFTVDKLQVMESHSENHFSKPNCHFSCDHCSFSVKTKRELMEHMFLHINKDRGEENSLKITAEETPPKPRGSSANGTHKKYHCVECPYVTDSKGQFLYHKQFHRPRDCPFKCSECTYMVSHKHLLHQHLRVHGLPAAEDQGNNHVEVNEDGSVVDDQPLDLHVQDMTVEAIHPTVLVWRSGRPFRMYRCRMCPRVYTKINDLNEHELGHGGAITITPSSVQNSSDYNEYINYHGGEGNENETILNNNNNTIVPLESQQKQIISPNSSDNNSTSGKSLHMCENCPARFFYEKELEIHSSFHQAKSEFQCNLCSYSAKQQYPHLHSHMKVHGLDYQMKTQQLLMRYPKASKLSKKKTTAAAKNLSSTFNIPQVNQFFANSHHSSFTTATPSSTSGGGVVDSIGGSGSKKTVIVCQKCPQKFHSKSSYQQHITFHGRDSVFLCRYCDYSVDTLKNLTVHELLHTGPENKISPLSTADSIYRTMLNKEKSNNNSSNGRAPHPSLAADDDRIDENAYIGNPQFIYPTYIKNGRVKEKRYKCSKCPSAFEKRDQFKVHVGLHGSDQRYKCAVCDYAVTYYANFIQHLKKHSTQPNIDPELLIAKPLSKASKSKTSTPALDVKNTSNRSSPAENVIARASTISSNAIKTNTHVSSATTNKKLWKCPNCPFTSPDKTAAQDHLQHHIPENSTKAGNSTFTCSYCDFTTLKKSSLKEHIRLHFHIPSEQVDSYMYAKDINVYVDGNYDEKIYSEKENYDDVDDNDDDEENERSITYIDMKSHLPVPMLQNESEGEEDDQDQEEDNDNAGEGNYNDKPQPLDCTT